MLAKASEALQKSQTKLEWVSLLFALYKKWRLRFHQSPQKNFCIYEQHLLECPYSQEIDPMGRFCRFISKMSISYLSDIE
ncbi:hypothetical protein B1199_06430 [Pseudoalteromonas ulvae]|uniref:Uncharacterized protein n=1 Tax=Pseudoalteromonas ulvae TaxID=107327 RepID=A0A244CQW8_PSEDV|nr:hypothetical protein B1199_06430 [Pseudoalteromonas ulvae]